MRRAWCEVLAWLAGYEFEDLDWQAVESALPDTDDDRGERWYEYPLAGEVARLARARLQTSVGWAAGEEVGLGEAASGVLGGGDDQPGDLGEAGRVQEAGQAVGGVAVGE
ncbi:hypothetical protein SAMN05444920_104126 [Nonomuraea solani]|uniref:Uncharacterized protein n=1 Tax=Nonomuraea solani TaxID=1144553 RepID=A0A1H6CLL2_9ACTN|nr:hypothetical protein SAMN05444920_104126 [Nonomuraea solani]